jgi:hypothetical protein
MKTYGEVEVQIHTFLTSALYEGECPASRPGALPPGKEAGTNQIGKTTCTNKFRADKIQFGTFCLPASYLYTLK